MRRFNPVKIEGAVRRINTYNQLLDLGTPDEKARAVPAFVGITLARKYNPSYATLTQLLTQLNSDIWFFCVPRTKWGAKMQMKLNKTGSVSKIPLTKNIRDALRHNRGLRRPVLNVPCKILIVFDKNPKAVLDDSVLYSHKSSQPRVIGELYMSLVRQEAIARKITRGV
tara:strand:- start:885 stop:1391 length:507 start_codon:yes stop_codon:yes gene_type:complete